MRLLDLTLATPAENLALDEAMLEAAEADDSVEALRLWEPRQAMVVVGRSSKVESEVILETCTRRGIPVLRRTSGGAAIVTGPGCLMYAVVLSYARRPALRSINAAHRFVLETIVAALGPSASGVVRKGTSDLAVGSDKFSGNSLRCKRTHVLYHGTLLYDFPLALISELLSMPMRQPTYRHGRPHEAFVRNLPADAGTLRAALVTAWDAREPYGDWPCARVWQLVEEKYSNPEWNFRV